MACKEAPAPLTHAEAQALEMASDSIVHASMNDGHSSMGGLAFALTRSSVQPVRDFASQKLNYLQFVSFLLFCLFSLLFMRAFQPRRFAQYDNNLHLIWPVQCVCQMNTLTLAMVAVFVVNRSFYVFCANYFIVCHPLFKYPVFIEDDPKFVKSSQFLWLTGGI